MGCSYKLQWEIFASLTIIFALTAIGLIVAGAVVYRNERIATNTHEQSKCKVMSSSYYQSTCRTGRYGAIRACFMPVWMVTFSITEETTINATIEQGRFWSSQDAQNRLDQNQIGMYYTCWYNTEDPSIARWDEPSTFVGMMLLIFGSLTAAVAAVGIFLSYRARKKFKENEM